MAHKWPPRGGRFGAWAAENSAADRRNGCLAQKWPKNGPFPAQFRSRRVRNRIRLILGSKTGPFPAQKGPKNGWILGVCGLLAHLRPETGQKWPVFGQGVSGARVTRVIREQPRVDSELPDLGDVFLLRAAMRRAYKTPHFVTNPVPRTLTTVRKRSNRTPLGGGSGC